MNSLIESFRFLTILPLPGGQNCTEESINKAGRWFPIAGLLIGLLLGAVSWGILWLFPVPVAAVLIAFCMIGISGGLHLRGLAATADGFLISTPRERTLEIMQDSRVSAMGVTAIAFSITLKVVCLASIAPVMIPRAVAIAVLVGRCWLLALLVLMPTATDSGLGNMLKKNRTIPEMIFAGCFAVAAAVVIGGLAGAFAVWASVIICTAFGVWCMRKISGATGDTLGAACEISEMVCLLCFAAKPVNEIIIQTGVSLW